MPRDQKYPIHIHAAILESDRLLELARERAKEAGFDPSEIRSADARRSKPATDTEIEDAEDSYLENGEMEPDDEPDDDIDDLERKKRELDQEEEEEKEEGQGDADSDEVSPARRGSSTRLMIERKLRHMAQRYAELHSVSYSQAYAKVALSPKGRRLLEDYTMASPT